MKKIFLIVTGVILLGLGALAALGYYEYLYTKPLTAAEVAELEVDWSVVTGGNWSPWVVAADGTQEWNPAKSFNDWLATVPEEDKVWADLVDVETGHYQFFRNEYLAYLPPNEVQWERLVPALDSDEAKTIYDRMIAALARPVMGCGLYNQSNPEEVAAAKKYGHEWADDVVPVKPEEDVEMILVLPPALGKQKGANSFVMAYAARRLEKGDADEFVRACQVSFHNAALGEEVPTLIGQLVKFAIERHVVEYIDWAIDQHGNTFTDQQLADLGSLLAEPDAYTLHWRGEAMMFRDMIRRLVNENGSLKSRDLRKKVRQIGSESLGAATDLPVEQFHPSAQRLIYIYQELFKREMAVGYNSGDSSLQTGGQFLDAQRDLLGHFEQVALDTLLPAVSRTVDVALSARRYTNAVHIAVAARRHQLRHGSLPETLDAIDADLMSRVNPNDPYTGEHLIYQLVDSRVQVLPSYPQDEFDAVLWPKAYEQIVESDEPEYYDWELEGMTEEQIEEIKNQP